MGTLRVYRGDHLMFAFELGEGRTRVGRGTENQLVLEDKDKQVSRTHAEIWHEHGHYVIADLNSQNGVWIGERQIKSEEPLPPSVPITIGPYRLILVPEEPAVATPDYDIDGAEMTREQEAFVEPTLVEAAATMPPPPPPPPPQPAAQSQTVKPPTAKSAVSPKPPAPKTRSNKAPLMAVAAGIIALIAVAVVIATILKKPAEPEATDTGVSSTSTAPPTTTVPEQTPEERFQDHFGKAQAHIVALNKAGARDENTAALTALPDDPRGLAQRTAIELMPEPGAAPTPPPGTPAAADGSTPPAGTPKPVPPALPESLRVTARPGEPERDRAARERAARGHLEEGRKALGERQYDAAINALGAAITTSGRADFGNQPNEAGSLQRQARNAKTAAESAQRRANAQKALEEAKAIGPSDVLAASQKAREAAKLDPELEGVNEFLSSLVEPARIQGEAAMTAAKNYDNSRRPEQALKSYERAIQLLELVPAGHKDLGLAKTRVTELKAR